MSKPSINWGEYWAKHNEKREKVRLANEKAFTSSAEVAYRAEIAKLKKKAINTPLYVDSGAKTDNMERYRAYGEPIKPPVSTPDPNKAFKEKKIGKMSAIEYIEHARRQREEKGEDTSIIEDTDEDQDWYIENLDIPDEDDDLL